MPPFFNMLNSPSFRSKSLEKDVPLHLVHELPVSELQSLYDETVETIRSIDHDVSQAEEFQQSAGISPDEDWLHRAKKKRKICLDFAIKASAALRGRSGISFEEAYQKRLDEILCEELNPATVDRIKKEAKELALDDVGRN